MPLALAQGGRLIGPGKREKRSVRPTNINPAPIGLWQGRFVAGFLCFSQP